MLPSVRGDSFSLPPGLGLWGPDLTLVCSVPPRLILLGPLWPRSNVAQCAPRVSLQAGRAGWEGSLPITTSGPGVPLRASLCGPRCGPAQPRPRDPLWAPGRPCLLSGVKSFSEALAVSANLGSRLR